MWTDCNPARIALVILVATSTLTLTGCIGEALEIAAEGGAEGGSVPVDVAAARGLSGLPGDAETGEVGEAARSVQSEPRSASTTTTDPLSASAGSQGTNRIVTDTDGNIYMGGKIYHLDLATRTVQDVSTGGTVGTIDEHGVISRIDPSGTLRPFAEILNSSLVQQSSLYSRGTITSGFLRLLDSGTYIEILQVDRGWFQLRLADGSVGWAFAPIFMTRIATQGDGQNQTIPLVTEPDERKLVDSIRDLASQVQQGIHRTLSPN